MVEKSEAGQELPAIGWKQPIIPDAILGVDGRNIAVEFDRGQESLRFFARTKLTWYWRGLEGFPIYRVIIITDRQSRLESLARVVGAHGSRVLLARLDQIRNCGLGAGTFVDCTLAGGKKLP